MIKKVTIYYDSEEDCITIKDKLNSILKCDYLIFDEDDRTTAIWNFNPFLGIYECSDCKKSALYNSNRGFELSKYCPSCGRCMSNGVRLR